MIGVGKYIRAEPLPIHYVCQVTSGKAYSVAFSVFSNLMDGSLLHRGGVSKFTLCFHVFPSPYLSEEFALIFSK